MRTYEIKNIINLESGSESATVPLYLVGACTSSIDVGWDLAESGKLPLWGSVLAESQTAGRGRMGRVWQSPPGHVYGALRLPAEPPFDGPGASLALALLLAAAFQESFGWAMELKWPNDLIFNGGKIAGLLLESRRAGLVAGVGFNLGAPPEGDWARQREPGAPTPAALPFTGTPEALWTALVKKAILLYKEKYRARTMAGLVPAAEQILFWRNRMVLIHRPAAEPPAPGPELRGRLLGLGPEGELRLASEDSREYRLWSGTVCLA